MTTVLGSLRNSSPKTGEVKQGGILRAAEARGWLRSNLIDYFLYFCTYLKVFIRCF